MAVTFVTAVALLFWMSPTQADEGLARFLTSKSNLAQMDWANPKASPISKGIASLSDDGQSRNITFLGASFKATADMSGNVASIVRFEGNDKFESCDVFSSKLSSNFGKPLFDDASLVMPLSDTERMRMVFEFYQWDFGKTRVSASCTGVTTSPALQNQSDGLTWDVSFSSPSRFPKLMPKFALRCSRTIEYSDGTTKNATDLAFWVDLNASSIMNADQTALSDAGTFKQTEDQINFSVTRNDVKSDYSIDRITGSLRAEVKANSLTVSIHGECTKTQSLAPKF